MNIHSCAMKCKLQTTKSPHTLTLHYTLSGNYLIKKFHEKMIQNRTHTLLINIKIGEDVSHEPLAYNARLSSPSPTVWPPPSPRPAPMLDTATPATLLTALVLVTACNTAVEAKSFRNVFTDEERFMLVPVHNEDTLTSWVRICSMQQKLNIINICFQSIVANKFAILLSAESVPPRGPQRRWGAGGSQAGPGTAAQQVQ